MTPEQLKASILQRAMEGKLVPQDPTDEPASELLKRIKAEKEKLIADGKIKRDKKETELFRGADGKPYEKLADGTVKEFKKDIPTGWTIVYFPDICALENGSMKRGPFGSSITKSMFVPRGKNTYKVYEQGNAIRKTTEYGDYWLSEQDYLALKNFSVKPKDIIVSCAGTIGEIFQIPEDAPEGVINQALLKLTLNADIINFDYFKIMFASLVNLLKENSIGSAIKNLASIKFLKYDVPILLPPLAEQQRIVEQVEKALTKINEYAESYNKLQQLDKEFPDKLKKSILQYAMQGKLVAQDPNDEPVEVLLEKIKSEKQKLYEEGKLKKKDLAEIVVTKGDDSSPYGKKTKFDIDFQRKSSWLLLPLEKIVRSIPTKNHQIKQSAIRETGRFPVVSQSQALVEGFSNDKTKILENTDSLIIFGDHTRTLKLIDFPFIIGADGVKVLQPIGISPQFLKYHLECTILFVKDRGYARHYSYLKNKIIGIPSELEQNKITKKVDLLFEKVALLKR
ncbi:type I restriction-modification system, S subunit [Streptococcus agalactiae]|uniref:restriction endonuclease subunit S n=4 Tax=Streptococcus TaxID=1301 RepID=UPI000E06BD1D|nr:restriction endonuclease subunit S [Streptococcus agalactiae]MDK6299963.1 restriction endonuclease subunit S [Streptococcus agalactiae]SUN43862.1 type I restriction-modification system, S subunit [Streptococcus agalactiae]